MSGYKVASIVLILAVGLVTDTGLGMASCIIQFIPRYVSLALKLSLWFLVVLQVVVGCLLAHALSTVFKEVEISEYLRKVYAGRIAKTNFGQESMTTIETKSPDLKSDELVWDVSKCGHLCKTAWLPFLRPPASSLPNKYVLYFFAFFVAPWRMLGLIFLLASSTAVAYLFPGYVQTTYKVLGWVYNNTIGGLSVEFFGEVDPDTACLVANHTCALDDHILWFTPWAVKWVAKSEVQQIPFLGKMCEAVCSIFIDRSSELSRKEAVKDIVQCIRGYKNIRNAQDRKLIIFAEGTCGNHTHLVPFKLTCFSTGLPIQPVCLRFSNPHVSYVYNPSIIVHMAMLLSIPYVQATVTYLPTVRTVEEGEEAMSRCAGIPMLSKARLLPEDTSNVKVCLGSESVTLDCSLPAGYRAGLEFYQYTEMFIKRNRVHELPLQLYWRRMLTGVFTSVCSFMTSFLDGILSFGRQTSSVVFNRLSSSLPYAATDESIFSMRIFLSVLIGCLVSLWLVLSTAILLALKKNLHHLEVSKKVLHKKITVPDEWHPFVRQEGKYKLPSKLVLYLSCFTIAPLRLTVFACSPIVGFLAAIFVKDDHIMRRVASFCSRCMLWGLGLKVKVHGKPSRSAPCYVSNHVSGIDACIFMAADLDVAFVAKGSIQDVPLIGYVLKRLGAIFVNRSDAGSRSQAADAITDYLTQWTPKQPHLFIFPEGTCSHGQGVMLSFKAGAFRAKRPIQPARLEYTCPHDALVSIDDTLAWASLLMCTPLRRTVNLHWLPKIEHSEDQTVDQVTKLAEESVAGNVFQVVKEAGIRVHYECWHFFETLVK